MASLYDVLGTRKGASAADLKRAYRRRAKATHPDAGGSADEFKEVQGAWLVLSDPVKRDRYDRTGTVDDDAAPLSREAQAIGFLVDLIQQVVGSFVQGQSRDPTQADVVVGMRAGITSKLAALREQRGKLDLHVETLRDMGRRLHKKSRGKSRLVTAIVRQADMMAIDLARLDEAIDAHECALEMVNDHTFDPKVVLALADPFAALREAVAAGYGRPGFTTFTIGGAMFSDHDDDDDEED